MVKKTLLYRFPYKCMGRMLPKAVVGVVPTSYEGGCSAPAGVGGLPLALPAFPHLVPSGLSSLFPSPPLLCCLCRLCNYRWLSASGLGGGGRSCCFCPSLSLLGSRFFSPGRCRAVWAVGVKLRACLTVRVQLSCRLQFPFALSSPHLLAWWPSGPQRVGHCQVPRAARSAALHAFMHVEYDARALRLRRRPLSQSTEARDPANAQRVLRSTQSSWRRALLHYVTCPVPTRLERRWTRLPI